MSQAMGTAFLSVENATVVIRGNTVVHGATFSLGEGEIGCLLGPSGCGKSTLLRSIAGFEVVAEGSISMAGRILSDSARQVNPELRNIGMVFQDFALFPHLSVAQNIGFGLRGRGRKDQQRRIDELLELIGLSGFQQRYPHSLSGGEQQRVALARAMAPKPGLLLLDEPFSSLDVELRQSLVPQVREILLREGIGAVLVTHDQMEAFAMADRVGIMQSGTIHQWANAYRLYHQPGSRFVADFVGEGEFVEGRILDECRVESVLGTLGATTPHGFAPGSSVDILVRPDDVLHDDHSGIQAKIVAKSFRGSHFLYRVALASGEQVLCFADSHHNHEVGEAIGLSFRILHLVMFPRQG